MSYILDGDASSKSDKIKHKFYSSANRVLYLILNYDNLGLSYDDYHTTKYRSVVFAYPEKRLLCYSPPKSLPSNVFMNMYPNICASVITVCEAVEGIMVNLFFDVRINRWEIATKTAVGGRYWFYGAENAPKTTFYKMFLDAFHANPDEDINSIAFFDYLPKTACYTFILQHPDNPIILPVDKPRIFLVNVFCISQNYADYVPTFIYEHWDVFKTVNNVIEFPKTYQFLNYASISDALLSQDGVVKYGFVIKNEFSGDMTTVITADYENLKLSLRTQHLHQYEFLCLNRINKIEGVCKVYPNKRRPLLNAKQIYDGFIKNVHRFYMEQYVHKNVDIIPDKYRSHIYKIHHSIYLPSLASGTRKKITRTVVDDYFKGLEPRELIYILRR